MTSQGVGAPFGPGEEIMGYQACGMRGSCYIDVDGEYGEKLTHISAGDEAVFRYVKNEESWQGIDMVCNGSGDVEVRLGDRASGTIKVRNGQCEYGCFFAEPGMYELVLKFKEADGLEVLKITLY